MNKLPITSTTFGVPPTPVRPSEYGGHWLESYQGPRDSYIRAMNQHGDSKGTRFLLKRISKVMNSTNGQSWKVERARIRNRHRGFFRIRIRKFQQFEFESAGARRKHHPRLEGQSENRDQGKIIGKSKISTRFGHRVLPYYWLVLLYQIAGVLGVPSSTLPISTRGLRGLPDKIYPL